MHPARACLVCLLPLAALAAGAEDNAPLAESRKELKKLEASPGPAGEPTAKDALRSTVLPALQSPAASLPVFPHAGPEQRAREQRQRSEEQKNWLLNGVNQLRREALEKGRLPGETGDEREIADAPPDPTDATYLLKLYEKQRTAEAKAASALKTRRSPQADPFAPFLNDWLAGSPVKNQLLSDQNRLTLGGVAGTGFSPTDAPGHGSENARSPGTGGLQTGMDPAGETQVNPYLAAAGGDAAGSSPFAAPRPVAPSGALQPGSVPAQPATSSPATVIPPKNAGTDAAARKPPPPPLAEEQKYFPQLKKF
jgi:hypothetical protein